MDNIWLIKASGIFLCDSLTVDLIEGPQDDLYSFIENNHWEPCECWRGADIWEQIEGLASDFEMVHKEALGE